MDKVFGRKKKSEGKERATSERAVSFEFLKSFKDDIPQEYTTRDVVNNIIITKTEEEKCPYTKLLDANYVGNPTYFLSHRWDCKFWFVYELLEEFMRQNPSLKPHKTFFWIDIFAVTQHDVPEKEVDFEQISAAISMSNKTLLCMDEDGLVLTRIWCLYEIWRSTVDNNNNNKDKKKDTSKLVILSTSLNDQQIQKVFRSFDIKRAQSTKEDDKLKILDIMDKSLSSSSSTTALSSSSSTTTTTTATTKMIVNSIKQSLVDSCVSEINAMGKSHSHHHDNQQYIKSLLKCSLISRVNGNMTISLEKAKQAEDIARKNSLSKDILSDCLNSIGNAYYSLRKYQDAHNSYQESLDLRIASYGTEHELVATSFNNIANVLDEQGDHKEAEELYRKALDMRTKLLGMKHPLVIDIIENIAGSLYNQGKHKEAETKYKEALKLRIGRERNDSNSYIKIANIKNVIDNIIDNNNNNNVSHNNNNIMIYDIYNISDTIDSIGEVLISQGKYSDGKEYCELSLNIRNRLNNNNNNEYNHEISVSYTNIANAYRGLGDLDKSNEIHTLALKIRMQLYGQKNPYVIQSMSSLASILYDQHKYSESERDHRSVLELRQEIYRGMNSPYIPESQINLAESLYAQNKYEESFKLYKSAIDNRINIYGINNQIVKTTINRYIKLLDDQGRKDESQIYRDILKDSENHIDSSSSSSSSTESDKGSNSSYAHLYALTLAGLAGFAYLQFKK